MGLDRNLAVTIWLSSKALTGSRDPPLDFASHFKAGPHVLYVQIQRGFFY